MKKTDYRAVNMLVLCSFLTFMGLMVIGFSFQRALELSAGSLGMYLFILALLNIAFSIVGRCFRFLVSRMGYRKSQIAPLDK